MLANPPLVWKLLGATEDGTVENAAAGWFSRFFSRGSTTKNPVGVAPIEDIEIDKSWHGIHYLLTGVSSEGEPPLNFLLSGGTEVGSIDVGYGTARAFSAAEVMRISAALADVSDDDLLSRFVPEEMARLEIYPDIWEDDTDNAREYCLEYFRDVKAFVGRTAASGNGMVISIT